MVPLRSSREIIRFEKKSCKICIFIVSKIRNQYASYIDITRGVMNFPNLSYEKFLIIVFFSKIIFKFLVRNRDCIFNGKN